MGAGIFFVTHPLAATVLLPLTPLLWRLGYALSAKAVGERRLGYALAPAAAIACTLLAVHVLGLFSHSFYFALFAGFALLAALGLRRWELPDALGPAPLLARRWFWLGLAVAVGFMLGPELRFVEHDENIVAGHISIPLEIQNGIYPPHHTTFPQLEYAYHYAIDLLGAIQSTLLGQLHMQASVHLLAVLLWAYLFWLAWTLGERLIGDKVGSNVAGPITAFTVLFAGGFAFLCIPLHPLGSYLMSNCSPLGTWITPPLISNFLQHPWSLGMPLFFAILLVFDRRAAQLRHPAFWALLSLLFFALAFSQMVLFLTVLPTVVAIGSQVRLRPVRDRWIRFLPWGLAIVLIASQLHGFFAKVAKPESAGIVFHPIWKEGPWSGVFAWNVDALGLLLPLGLAGLFFFRGDTLALAVLAFGALAVRNLFKYSHSWDIVKFSMVTQICLAILSAATIVRLFQAKRLLPLGAIALAGSTFFGFAWPVALGLDLPGLIFDKQLASLPSAADQQAIAYLRGRVAEGEGVYRRDRAETYALYGGLPQPSSDWGVGSFGFSQRLFDERQRLIDHPAEEPGPFLAQGFTWVVVQTNDGNLLSYADRWTREGKADLMLSPEGLRVYHLRGNPSR